MDLNCYSAAVCVKSHFRLSRTEDVNILVHPLPSSAVLGQTELIGCVWGIWQQFFRGISRSGKEDTFSYRSSRIHNSTHKRECLTPAGFCLVSRTEWKEDLASALVLSVVGIYLYEALGETWCAFKWYFPFSFKRRGIYIKVTPLSPAMIIMCLTLCQTSPHNASQVSKTKSVFWETLEMYFRQWLCVANTSG